MHKGLALGAPAADSSELAPGECPLCHTMRPTIGDTVTAGDNWQCLRCSAHWSAERLATAAAYARYIA